MTIRTKVVWRIVVLATVLALGVGGFAGFVVYRKARIRAQYMRLRAEGIAAAGSGDARRAVDLLASYLYRYPDDADALSQYVAAQSSYIRALTAPDKRSEKLDHIRSNVSALRHLIKLPNRNDAQRTADRRQLLDIYVQVGAWSEALDLADVLLPEGKTPDKADVPVLAGRTKALAGPWQAQGLQGLKRFPEAIAPAVQWSRLAPADIDAQFELLFLLQRTQQFDAFWSASTKKPTTQSSPTPDEPVVQVARALAQAAATELAGGSHSQQVDDPRPEMIQARALMLVGRRGDATDPLISAAGRSLADRYVATVLMDCFNELGRPDQSLLVLKQMQQRDSDDPSLRAQLAPRLWELGDAKSAADLLSKLDPGNPSSDSELLGVRASALSQLGRRDEVAAIRRALGSRSKDATAAAWAAILDAAGRNDAGSLDQVIKLCQAALQEQNSPYVAYHLGEAYAARGDMPSAIAAWTAATRSSYTWAAPAVRLADALADTGRYDAAVEAARVACRRSQTIGPAITLFRVSDLAVENGRLSANDVLADVNKLIAQVQGKDQGELLCVQVDLLALSGKPDDAIAEANKALQNHDQPLSQRSLLRLVAISRRHGLGIEDKCLARCEAEHGVTPDVAFAKALDLYKAKRGEEGLKRLTTDRAKATDPQSVAWRTAWARYLDLVQDPGAAKAIADLADSDPNNLRLQEIVLESRSTRGDAKLLARIIDRVKALTGEQGTLWPLARARWVLQFGTSTDRPEALKLLADVTRLAPDLLEAHVLMGRAFERDKRLAEAVEQFRLATNLSPNSAALGYELARLLELRGDFEGAHGELARIRSLLPTEDADARQKAAILAFQSGDPELALNLTEEAAAQVARQGSQGLLTAQMLWLTGKSDQAEAMCRTLLEKPDLPVIAFAARLYATQGKMDEAQRVLSRLDELKLEPGLKQLALADFASRFETPAATLQYLEEATRLAPANPTPWRQLIGFNLNNGRTHEALAALADAIRQVPVGSASTLRALKEHADLLALASEPPLRPLVSVLVSSAPGSDDGDTAAQALQAVLKARGDINPAQLAAALQGLTNSRPPLLPLQLCLAAVYDDLNQPEDAIATATRAAQQFPGDAQPQAALVTLLQKQGRWAEVLLAARKWRDLSAADPVSPDLVIAQAYLKLNRANDALDVLDPYIKNAKGNPRAYERVLAAYAAAQQAAGKSGVAELMEPLLKQGPRGRATWMMFAVANLSPVEAVGWLDRAQKVIPPDQIDEQLLLAQMWRTIAETGHDPSSLQRARAIVTPLADKPDAAEATILALAGIDEQDGRLQDAQNDYRRVLKLNPNSVVARNNLAMMLAKSGQGLTEAASLVQDVVKRPEYKTSPFLPSLLDTLAFVQGKLKNYDEAETNAQAAINLRPTSVQYHVTLTQLQLDGGKLGAAANTMRDVEKLLRDLEARQQGFATLPQPLRQQIEALRLATKGAANQAAAK